MISGNARYIDKSKKSYHVLYAILLSKNIIVVILDTTMTNNERSRRFFNVGFSVDAIKLDCFFNEKTAKLIL